MLIHSRQLEFVYSSGTSGTISFVHGPSNRFAGAGTRIACTKALLLCTGEEGERRRAWSGA